MEFNKIALNFKFMHNKEIDKLNKLLRTLNVVITVGKEDEDDFKIGVFNYISERPVIKNKLKFKELFDLCDKISTFRTEEEFDIYEIPLKDDTIRVWRIDENCE